MPQEHARGRDGAASTWFAVASGGALGSMARFWLTGAVTALTGPRFP